MTKTYRNKADKKASILDFIYEAIKLMNNFLGTNWTTEIVRQILNIHDEELMEMSKNIPLLFSFYEGGGGKSIL